jgi:hypothetical protein
MSRPLSSRPDALPMPVSTSNEARGGAGLVGHGFAPASRGDGKLVVLGF